MTFIEPKPSGRLRRVADLFAELTGVYRIAVLVKRSAIAFSAYVKSPSRLHIGRNVVIQTGAILHCGGKAWSNYRGYVRLREGVRVGPYCVIYGAGGVDLGEHVHLGPGVKIMSQAGSHNSGRLTSAPTFILNTVRIGPGCWIGAGAIILGGVDLGCCVSVAPNSVVSASVPDYAVVVGNPARVMFKNEALSQ